VSAGTIATLAASALLAALGQLLLKLGASGAQGPMAFVNVKVAAGLVAYFLGLLLWLHSLARAPLHVVYPFTMLTFVVVLAMAVVFLGERPSGVTIAGWCLIAFGVLVATAGA
jgi:drug/metabolite transporter (DMT)-like permease